MQAGGQFRDIALAVQPPFGVVLFDFYEFGPNGPLGDHFHGHHSLSDALANGDYLSRG